MRRFFAAAAILAIIGIFAGYAAVHADVSARVASCANVGNAPALCQDLGESVVAWQHALASSIPQLAALLFVALISELFIVLLALVSYFYPPYPKRDSLLPRSPLQQLFSDGILHPKLY
jgi:hypothetical protein